jgi:arsenite methyltransferase
MKTDEIKMAVKVGYGQVAREAGRCCDKENCCGVSYAIEASRENGYTEEVMKSVPENANLGLGCGNPIAIASLKPGETVLDLGSGAGFDCFIAAGIVGPTGRAIGVDMTPEMLSRAQANTESGGYTNVEFREGEIENLPVDSNTVDAVISNCVINLSPDKPRVFAEAFRVLKPGGRLMVSDIVLNRELPEYVRDSVRAYVGCISGAVLKEDYLGAIKDAGFDQVEILEQKMYPIDFLQSDATVQAAIKKLKRSDEQVARELENTVLSVSVKAVKPV